MDKGPTIAQVDARLVRLEKQIGMLFEHLGLEQPDPSDGIPSEVVQLARDGKQMHAIKKYMELTGVDMTTAQQVVYGITL
jgi:hypothetical protein